MTKPELDVVEQLRLAAERFDRAATGDDLFCQAAGALREILAAGARSNYRTAPPEHIERARTALRRALPVVEAHTAEDLPVGHVAFAMTAAEGILDLFGADYDGRPRIELTAIILDRRDYTALLASELEAIACRRDIAARGDVLRRTAEVLVHGRLGHTLKLN